MADRWEDAEDAVRVALELAVDVRDSEPDRLHRRIRAMRRHDPLLLEQVVVALAAMVPDDVSPAQLLAWTDELMPSERLRVLRRAELDARRYTARTLRVVPPDGRADAEGSAR